MKYEWRKKEKDTYIPKTKPEIKNIKKAKFLVLEGQGNPNSEAFSDTVQTLYSLSYGIKMAPKKNIEIKNYFDYTVFPLEGNWSLSQKGIDLYTSGIPVIELKDYMIFKMMIKQPDFVTIDLLDRIKAIKPGDRNSDVSLCEIEEGLVCQMLHIGSFDTEPESFKIMEDFCVEQGYERTSKSHKEIYLSDPRRTAVEKLKTTLRFNIEKK